MKKCLQLKAHNILKPTQGIMFDEQQTRIRHRKQTLLTSINAFAMNSEQQVKFLQKTAPNLVAVNQLR